ncbi:hypothetical protein TNCV_3509011, partial [Trichonephila clavipes]
SCALPAAHRSEAHPLVARVSANFRHHCGRINKRSSRLQIQFKLKNELATGLRHRQRPSEHIPATSEANQRLGLQLANFEKKISHRISAELQVQHWSQTDRS